MVSSETLLNYTDRDIPFTVHTDASDKMLRDVISNNNKPIAFLSRRLRKIKHNYTMTEGEPLLVVEYQKQFRGILF